MVFATVPNTYFHELGPEQPGTPSPEVVELESASCMSNKSIIYSTSAQTGFSEGGGKTVTSYERRHSESKAFRLKKRSWIEAGSIGRPS